MKHTRKSLLVIFTIFAMMVVAACGGNGGSNNSSNNSSGNNGGAPAAENPAPKAESAPANEKKSKVYEFDVGIWFPATNPVYTKGWEPWVKYVEEQTNGQVKLNLHPGSALGKSTSVLDDVKGGTYDIGQLVPDYYADTPLFKLTILGLPFAFPDAETGHKVMTKYVEMNGLDGFDGMKFGGIFTSDPYIMLSPKPVRSVADLQGKKVRLAGKAWQSVIEDWGAVPVNIPTEESYLGLERGTIDVMLYSASGTMSQKFYEPAPYITDVGAMVTSATAVMNEDKFNSLPADIQKQFEEDFFPRLINNIVGSYMEGSKTAFTEIGKQIEGKGEIIQLDAAGKAQFQSAAAASWNAWIEDANSRGFDGKKLMSDFIQLLKEEGVTPPIEL